MPFLIRTGSFGQNQFAYTPGRGARDVLAMLLLTWLPALASGKRIAVYCSDVTGAFDRVELKRLVAKMKAKKLHPKIVAVLTSWLRQRVAHVVVGGALSVEMALKNMIYQGNVLGPLLWNLFYEDARLPIQKASFTEVVYADDLNGFRIFSAETNNEDIQKSLQLCQRELHAWARAN